MANTSTDGQCLKECPNRPEKCIIALICLILNKLMSLGLPYFFSFLVSFFRNIIFSLHKKLGLINYHVGDILFLPRKKIRNYSEIQCTWKEYKLILTSEIFQPFGSFIFLARIGLGLM